MQKTKLDIILPVNHEEQNIREVLLGIKKKVKTPFTTILVYDDKNDPTVNIAQKLENIIASKIIKNKYGKGIVGAIKTGFSFSQSKIIIIMMADLSDQAADIDKMVQKIEEGYDLVCASRYLKGGKRNGGSKLKGLLSYLACTTLKFLTGIPTTDATNAFKCFRKDLAARINIESIGGFELPLEITIKSYLLGAKITEIPTIWNERRRGKSKFKLLIWLPHYLRWYLFALKSKFLSRF